MRIAPAAQSGKDSSLQVDLHRKTSLEGLSVAGKVFKGHDQISTAMRIALRETRPLLRQRRSLKSSRPV
jgi:hypothetical protein